MRGNCACTNQIQAACGSGRKPDMFIPPAEPCPKPGYIPVGCIGSLTFTNAAVINPGETATYRIPTYQPLMLAAILFVGVDANVGTAVISDIRVAGQPLFSRVESGNFGDAAQVAGLGQLTGLNSALYEAGLNPLPPQDYFDNNVPLEIDVTNPASATAPVAANEATIRLYLSNMYEVYGDGSFGMPPLGNFSKEGTRPKGYDTVIRVLRSLARSGQMALAEAEKSLVG